MPEPTSRDDAFADLFAKLPRTSSRDCASDGDASGGAPLTRRAAREAAARAEAQPSVEAPAPVEASVAAPVTAGTLVGAVRAAEEPAPSKRAATPIAGGATIEDLFAASHDDHAAHGARHDRDRRKSRIAAWGVLGVVLLVLGGIVTGSVWVWMTYEGPIRAFMGWEDPKDYEPGLAEGEVLVTIVSGDTGASISETLFAAGVTKTSDAFYDYLIKTAQNPPFHPGVYALQHKMTSEAALAAIMDPASKREHTAQLREGLTIGQTLSVLSESLGIPLADLEAAAADPSAYAVAASTLEGWLFPATYTFDPGVTAPQVIQRLVDETSARLDAFGVAPEDRQRVLTLAGLVQKESGPLQEDMRRIARVFLNRVDQGMLLQSDATVAYGAGITGTVWTTDEERADESNPYNTYVHLGMPPGPISSPGEDAIEAALNPADGPWLYFVAVDLATGETTFSETLDEHMAAVEQLQDWCAREENASYCE